MARLVGVDLPREKRLEVALTYIFGVGRTRAKETLEGHRRQPGPPRPGHETTTTSSSLRDYIEGELQGRG